MRALVVEDNADLSAQLRAALTEAGFAVDAAPDIADNLFDPFVSGRPDGQGLGLALVDKLMRDMGGTVQYSREGDPEVTVLRLLLPRAAE